MQAKRGLGLDVVEDAVRDHRFGSQRGLFRRLEEQHDAASKTVAVLRQQLGDAHANRGVTIMSASVHNARDFVN